MDYRDRAELRGKRNREILCGNTDKKLDRLLNFMLYTSIICLVGTVTLAVIYFFSPSNAEETQTSNVEIGGEE